MIKHVRSKVFFLFLFLPLLLVACGGGTVEGTAVTTTADSSPTGEQAEATENTLRTVVVGTSGPIASLDFADAKNIPDWELLRNINLGLLIFEPGTANVVLGVASSFEVSEDQLSYTFALESGWKYPDGSEMVAGDFVRSINRALRLNAGATNWVSPFVESVRAPDDNTVVIKLHSPRGDFPQIVSSAAFMPLANGQFPDDAVNKFPETLSGVGPWQILDFAEDEAITLERNPYYKPGFAENAPDRVVIKFFENSSDLVAALENGEIDIAWRSLDLSDVDHLASLEDITTYESGFGGIRTLLFNHRDEYLRSRLVRQAIALLIDRDEIIAEVQPGYAHPLYSVVPAEFLGANEAFLDRYGNNADVAAAQALLSEAGYFEFAPIEISLLYPAEQYGNHTGEIAQLLKDQLEATPAIQVTLIPLDWITFLSAQITSEFQISYLGWSYDRYPDSSNYLDIFAESEISSIIGLNYSNEEMDELLFAASQALDINERAALYEEAQNLFAEDVVSLPLFFEPDYAAWNNATIANLSIGPVGQLLYETIQMVE